MSLKNHWRRSGGKWTKLKRLIVEHRGSRCEKCGASGVTLEAHEVWEHVSAYRAGIDPKRIRQVMKAFREYRLKLDESLQRMSLARGRPRPVQAKKRPRVLVRALTDIELLCNKCHRGEHAWDVDPRWDFIMESRYSGFAQLPKFKTYAEWEAAMQDDADPRNEDERYYFSP